MKFKADNVVINSSARPSSQRATIPTTLTIRCFVFSGLTLFTTFPAFAAYVPLTGVNQLWKGGNGSSLSCIVTSSGGVKCWGFNMNGELGVGDNTNTNRLTPVDVMGLTSGVTAVATGGGNTCALTSSGGVKCWGYNSSGQLGDNTTTNRWIPADVTGLTSGMTAIAVAGSHTCALTNSGGVKCWGDNSSGQLGNGTTTNSLIPVDVTGLTSGVTAIAVGNTHTCALTSSGGIKCWGNNSSGQLGDTSTTSSSIPVDATSLGGITAVSVVASAEYTCILTSSGGVKCWGTTPMITNITPNLIPVDVTGLTSGVTAIATGWGHICALTNSGGVKCLNNNGSDTAIDVAGLSSGMTAIAVGWSHACALTNSGGIKCWGSDYSGELGNNSTNYWSYTPVDVLMFVDTPPTANGVTLSVTPGMWNTGNTVIANYTYGDAEADVESGTLYQWYQATDSICTTGKTAITGATAQTYTLASSDIGKYICFSVTPKNAIATGTEVLVTSSNTISKKSQTITFNPPTTGSSSNTATLSATATSGLPVTFVSTTPTVCTVSGNTLNLIGTGACTVTADQAGDANYAAATTVTQTIYASVKEIASPPVVIYQPATTPPATPLLTLFLQLEGNGSGTINTDPVSKCTSQTGCSYTLAPNTTLTLTPEAEADSVFTHWSGSKECLTGQLQLTIPTLCIAHFQRLYSLTLTVQGQGQVTSYDLHQQPRNSLCRTECQDPYSSDSLVYVQATPDKGMTFQGWGGDCSGSQNPYLVAMTKKLKCQANFVAAEPVVPPSKPKETPPPATTCPLPTKTTETSTPSANTPPSASVTPAASTTNTTTTLVTTPVTTTPVTTDKEPKTTDKDAKTTGNPSTAVTTSPVTTTTPVVSTTTPVVTTPPLVVSPPVVTTPAPVIVTPTMPVATPTPVVTTPPVVIAANYSCSTTGNIGEACNYSGREVTSLDVQGSGTVSNATLKTTVVNSGWVSNFTITATGKLTGGVLTGYIKNEGTLLDFDFKGMSIIGGTLGGVITNTSRVGGYFQDVTLLPNTKITGGTLKGSIKGDKNAPALLEDVRVKSGSKLSGVKLGKGVKLERGVILEDK